MLWSFGPNVSMLCSLATGRELCRRGNARTEEESFHVLHHKYIIFLQSNLNWHHCSGNKPIISLPPFSYHQAFFKKKQSEFVPVTVLQSSISCLSMHRISGTALLAFSLCTKLCSGKEDLGNCCWMLDSNS